jgi:hypothetical protein
LEDEKSAVEPKKDAVRNMPKDDLANADQLASVDLVKNVANVKKNTIKPAENTDLVADKVI